MTPKRLSAHDRLSSLERVFSVEDLIDQQSLSAKAASVYLARWQEAGLIGRLGPRCGVWVNFVQPGGEKVTWQDRVKGLTRKHPRAIVGGRSALEAAGWIMAQNAPTEILIPQGQSRAKLDAIYLTARAPGAHATLWDLARMSPVMGLPTLPPDVAVADMAARGEDVDLALRKRAGDIGPLVRRLSGRS